MIIDGWIWAFDAKKIAQKYIRAIQGVYKTDERNPERPLATQIPKQVQFSVRFLLANLFSAFY